MLIFGTKMVRFDQNSHFYKSQKQSHLATRQRLSSVIISEESNKQDWRRIKKQ